MLILRVHIMVWTYLEGNYERFHRLLNLDIQMGARYHQYADLNLVAFNE